MNTTRLYNRHNEVPPLATRKGKVDAAYYNHVQTGLKRIDEEIRIRIPKLKHMDLILQKNAWIVVDKVLHDYPIVCWTHFETEGRSALHEPIQCEIRFFHYAASMILKRTLEEMDQILSEIMETDESTVLPFNKDNEPG